MTLIGVLIDEMFEDVEYTEPSRAFTEAGHSLIHIGLRKGQLVKGKRKRTPVKIDESVRDVKLELLDAILIPGGCSP
ncbi:MAG: DJ-1/PfpI family protein, partial [Methanobacterium sp.]